MIKVELLEMDALGHSRHWPHVIYAMAFCLIATNVVADKSYFFGWPHLPFFPPKFPLPRPPFLPPPKSPSLVPPKSLSPPPPPSPSPLPPPPKSPPSPLVLSGGVRILI